MLKLVAQPDGGRDGWEHRLTERPVKLGRLSPPSDWGAPWDPQISQWHATLHFRGGKLHVQRAPRARSDIFYQGQGLEQCEVAPGEVFVIGRTVFSVEQSVTPQAAPTLHETTFQIVSVRKAKFLNADKQIEVLAKLFEAIRYSPGVDWDEQVLESLLAGVPKADVAALVRLEPPSPDGVVALHRSKQRYESYPEPRPSRRFVTRSLWELRQSLMQSQTTPAGGSEFTQMTQYAWATCTPLLNDPEPAWGLYYAGQSISSDRAEETHASNQRFVELLADLCGYVRQMRYLQQFHGLMNPLLSPAVRAALAGKDVDRTLEPRTCQVTVLFCDLRGSCRIAEEGEHDLPRLWERISEALSVMTSSIVDHGGVIGDFQGDAAMGFWGWPFSSDDQVEQACRAALAIRRTFAQESVRHGRPLTGFACGIGIASGEAMAGKLGTPQQFKVGVYGPVVNLAARLESMTKTVGVPILLDQSTVEELAKQPHPWARLRDLGTVQPFGMKKTFQISELLPAQAEPGDLPQAAQWDYQAALKQFNAGKWSDARALLQRWPQDGPSKFLTSYIAEHAAPSQPFDGVIRLGSK